MNIAKFLNLSMISSIFLIIFLSVPTHLFLFTFDIASLKPYDLLIVPLFLCFFIKAIKNNFKFYFNKNLVIFPLLYMIWGIIFTHHEFLNNSIFFGLRFLELTIIIFLLSSLSYFYLDIILKFTLLFTVFWIMIEFLASPFYIKFWGPRFTGQFTGPFELGAIAMMYLMLSPKNKILSFAITILSNSKLVFISYGIILVGNLKKIKFNILIAIIALIVFLIFTLKINFDLVRVTDFININFDFSYIYKIPNIQTHAEYLEFFFSRDRYLFSSDSSTSLRLATYFAALKSVDLQSFFIGNGPGFYGVALESSFLRVFSEAGIFVFIAFLFFIKELSRFYQKWTYKGVLVFFLLFLDLIFSIRFVTILFLFYFLAKQEVVNETT